MDVDVNVHPGKTEVRLAREREIYSAVYHFVKDALRQEGVIPTFKPDSRDTPQLRTEHSRGVSLTPKETRSNLIPGITGSATPGIDSLRQLYDPSAVRGEAGGSDIVRVDRKTGEILESRGESDSPVVREDSIDMAEREHAVDEILSDLVLIGGFADLYLLFQSEEDLFIVDQHTAHERVLYEHTLAQIEKEQAVGQQLLLPAQVELTPELFAVFDEIADVLNRSGFDISHFGGRMVNIEAVPAVLSRKSPEKMVLSILDDLAPPGKAGMDVKTAVAQSIACRAAVMAGDRLSEDEAVGLIHKLLKCENPYSCPHGRPTFIRIRRKDLDRQFGRT
jgi:DNA mismatch repair protein MutL